MSNLATLGFHHITLVTADALGRGVMAQDESQLPGGRDEALIASTTHPEPVPVITPDMTLTGLHHISAMTDEGLEISPVTDRTRFTSIAFKAPDGQPLVIATDGPGFTGSTPTTGY